MAKKLQKAIEKIAIDISGFYFPAQNYLRLLLKNVIKTLKTLK